MSKFGFAEILQPASHKYFIGVVLGCRGQKLSSLDVLRQLAVKFEATEWGGDDEVVTVYFFGRSKKAVGRRPDDFIDAALPQL